MRSILRHGEKRSWQFVISPIPIPPRMVPLVSNAHGLVRSV
jgi:hypothetical protein